MKRLQNKIEIEFVKGSISRHNNLMKQNNGDNLCKLALNDANISDISSNKSIASTTQLNDLNLASFVKNVVNILFLYLVAFLTFVNCFFVEINSLINVNNFFISFSEQFIYLYLFGL